MITTLHSCSCSLGLGLRSSSDGVAPEMYIERSGISMGGGYDVMCCGGVISTNGGQRYTSVIKRGG